MSRSKAISLALALTGTSACAGVLPGTQAGKSSDLTGTSHRIQIEGVLLNESLRESVGASVTAYRISPNGSLTELTNHFSTTDQEGRFTVAVDVPNGAPVDVLVRADSEFGYGLVVVPTDMQVEKSVPAQPITDETTLEAQVYLAARTAGIWPAGQSVSRLHGLISEPLAASVLREPDYASAVGLLSEATSAAAASWRGVLEDPNVGVKDAQLSRVFTALDWSLFQRDETLVRTADASRAEAAEADFEQSAPLAYGLAQVKPMQLSLAAQASAESMGLYARAMKSASRAQALSDAALLRAAFVAEAVNEAVYHSGTVAQRAAVHGASEVLRQKLTAAAEDPGHVEENLHAAWTHYRSEVQQVIGDALAAQHVELERLQEALGPATTAAITGLDALRDTDTPAQTAEATARVFAKFYADTATEATLLSTQSAGPAHNQTRALLAALGNLAIAAR